MGGSPCSSTLSTTNYLSTMPLTRPVRLTLASLLCSLLGFTSAHAEPFVPASADEVLEVLPAAIAGAEADRIRTARDELEKNPGNVEVAVATALEHFKRGRAEGDPRYYGYAESAISFWAKDPLPPTEILLIRAHLRQHRHEFKPALTDLDEIVKREPTNAQAWLIKAVVHMVQGDYTPAKSSCARLMGITSEFIAATCLSNVAALNGDAEKALNVLKQELLSSNGAPGQEQLWVLTSVAEIEQRLGRAEDAEKSFRAALAIEKDDSYLLTSFADFLLDQQRAAEVETLLSERRANDAMLLRLALARKQLGKDEELKRDREELEARFAASQKRGDSSHLREEALFVLGIKGDATRAAELAVQNWQLQREPFDLRLLAEAGVAARNTAAITRAKEWLTATKLEYPRVHKLLNGERS